MRFEAENSDDEKLKALEAAMGSLYVDRYRAVDVAIQVAERTLHRANTAHQVQTAKVRLTECKAINCALHEEIRAALRL